MSDLEFKKTDFPVFEKLREVGEKLYKSYQLHNEVCPLDEAASEEGLALVKEVSETGTSWKEVLDQIDKQFNTFEELRGHTLTMVARFREHQEKTKKLQTLIQQKENDIASLDKELQAKESTTKITIRGLESQFEAKQTTVRDQMQELDDQLEDKRQKTQDRLGDFDSEVNAHQQKTREEMKKLDADVEAKRRWVKRELEGCDTEVGAHQQKTREEMEKLDADVKAKRQWVEKELEHCRTEIGAHQQKTKEEIGKLDADVEAKRQCVERELGHCRREANAHRNAAKEEMEKLDADVEAKRESIQPQLDRLDTSVEAKKTWTRQQLRGVDTELNAKKQAVDELKTEHEQLRNSCSDLNEQETDLIGSLASLDHDIKETTNNLVTLRESKVKAEEEHNCLDGDNKRLIDDSGYLCREISDKLSKLRQYERELRQAKEAVEGYQAQVQHWLSTEKANQENVRLKGELTTATQALTEAGANNRSLRDRLSEEKVEHGKTMDDLRRQLQGAQNAEKKAVEQIKVSQNAERRAIGQLQEAQNAKKEVVEQLKDSQNAERRAIGQLQEAQNAEKEVVEQLKDSQNAERKAIEELRGSQDRHTESLKNSRKVHDRLREQRTKAEADGTAALANFTTVTNKLDQIGRIETQLGQLHRVVVSQGVQKEAMQKKDETHESIVKDLGQVRTDLARISKERDDLEREKTKISLEKEKVLTKMTTTIKTQQAGLLGAANVFGKVRLIQEGLTRYRNIIVASADEKFSKVAGLEEKLRQETSSKATVEAQLEEANSKAAESKKTVERKVSEISNLKTQLESAQSALRDLKKQLEEKESVIQTGTQDRAILQQDLTNARGRIGELEERERGTIQRQEDLNDENDQLREDLAAFNSRRDRVFETPDQLVARNAPTSPGDTPTGLRNALASPRDALTRPRNALTGPREASPELLGESFTGTERTPPVGGARGEGSLENEIQSYVESFLRRSGLPLMRRSPGTARGQARVDDDTGADESEAFPRIPSDASLGLEDMGDQDTGEMGRDSTVGRENPRKRPSTDQGKLKIKRTRRGVPEPHILHTDQDVPLHCQQFTALDMSLPPAEWQFSWAMPDRVLEAFKELIRYDMEVRNGYIRQDPLHYNLESKCLGCATTRCKGGCQFSRIGGGRARDVYHACEECRKRNRPCLIVTAPGEFIMLPVKREQSTPPTDASHWIT